MRIDIKSNSTVVSGTAKTLLNNYKSYMHYQGPLKVN